MLYDLFVISNNGNSRQELFDLIKTTGTKIINDGGVIRKIASRGQLPLPYKIKKGYVHHLEGTFWQILFYANPEKIKGMKKSLLSQKSVLRAEILKPGKNVFQCL